MKNLLQQISIKQNNEHWRDSRLKLVFLTFLLLFFSSIVFAAPSITSVSGTITHSQTITITGSGFGSKSPAAPILYDTVDGMYSTTVEGAIVPTGGSYVWGDLSASSVGTPTFTLTNPRGKYKVKYTNKNSSGSKNAVVGHRAWSQCSGASLYVSWWLYPHTTPGSSTNKFLRATPDGGWTNGSYGASSVIWSPWAPFIGIFNASGSPIPQQYNNAGYGEIGAWNRFEILINNNVFPSPSVKSWVNHTQANSINATSSIPAITGIYTIGADFSGATNPPQLEWGEIYVDNTPARVEIGNASTWSACTHTEIQPPTAWSTTSATIKVNQGSFADGVSAYLYLIDSNNNANQNGYPITFGSSGGSGSDDTTHPSTPTGVTVQII